MPTQPDKPRPSDEFIRTWQSPPGLLGYLSVVNNRPIGRRFMALAFGFFLVGGVLALIMRIQLAVSGNTFLGPDGFNRLFTMHGATMMYLFTVPFLEGLALYMLPLMIGSRDVAYPRLSSFGFWTFFFGGAMFYTSFLVGDVPDAGWFAYTPLSRQEYSGIGIDFFLLGLGLVEISGIAAGAEIIVTVLKLRAPGMSISRMPLFAWAMLVVGFMILFAFTTLLAATMMLELDRAFGMHFFNPDGGGSTILWQHLFWFFGHPEVYIAFIPAAGLVSTIIPVFARRSIVGYKLIVVALVVMGFVSFGLWAHHMFATGLPELTLSFFTAASLMIGIASGIQIFAWIATLWGRRPVLQPPMLYMLGFVFVFVAGGITGIMVAVLPFDLQVHDSYFVVAHFHYVLIGGVVFPIFAAIHYWWPKIRGRVLDSRLGALEFTLVFVGFNVAFFPMHLMGFEGMPRRVYTYPEELGLDAYNMIATIGSFMLGAGVLVLLINIIVNRLKPRDAEPDPWNGQTLEWQISSPPPVYGFFAPPLVQSREPAQHIADPKLFPDVVQRARSALAGRPVDFRAELATDTVTGMPVAVHPLSGPTIVPFLSAVALLVAFVGVLFSYYLITLFGLVFLFGTLVRWLWPDEERLERIRSSEVGTISGLPMMTTGSGSIGWWGMMYLLGVLGMVYAVMNFSYLYIRLLADEWPLDGLPMPDFAPILIACALILAMTGAAFLGRRLAGGGRVRLARVVLASGALFGLGVLAIQAYELITAGFTPQTNAYGTVFFVAHYLQMTTTFVAGALLIAAAVRIWRVETPLSEHQELHIHITSLYVYFITAAGLVTFAVVYVLPYL